MHRYHVLIGILTSLFLAGCSSTPPTRSDKSTPAAPAPASSFRWEIRDEAPPTVRKFLSRQLERAGDSNPDFPVMVDRAELVIPIPGQIGRVSKPTIRRILDDHRALVEFNYGLGSKGQIILIETFVGGSALGDELFVGPIEILDWTKYQDWKGERSICEARPIDVGQYIIKVDLNIRPSTKAISD